MNRHCEERSDQAIQCASESALDVQVRPAPQAAAMSGGHGDLRIFASLAMTTVDQPKHGML
jgi:hypothetical protein